MKHLVIYCHPNPKSFCHALVETFTQGLRVKGHDVMVRDLYALGFNPVLDVRDFQAYETHSAPEDVRQEQEHVRWADVITFIYPLWWTGFPALCKGYVDRVFSIHFAYDFNAKGSVGLLRGKKVYMITTMGATEESYAKEGLFQAMYQTIDRGVTEFCGMEVIGHKYFGSIGMAGPSERQGMLEEIRNIAMEM